MYYSHWRSSPGHSQVTLTLSANKLMQRFFALLFLCRTRTLHLYQVCRMIVSPIFDLFKKYVLPFLIAWILEGKVCKKLAADHVCASLLTGSVSFSISDVEFISQKTHTHISARIAGCKNECIPSIRKSINLKISIFIVIYCLPGKGLLQFRRPKPDTAFSRDVSASGIPLVDIFRRQRFLKKNF